VNFLKKHASEITFAIVLLAASFVHGQVITATPLAINSSGGPAGSVLVTVCTTNPGTGACGSLATIYTDITITTACSGTLQPLNNSTAPSVGAACSNPGYTDNLGNAVAYATAGQQLFCQYSAAAITTYTQPCPTSGATVLSSAQNSQAPAILGNWEGSPYPENPAGSGVLNSASANQVECFMFRLAFPFSFNTLSFYPVTSTASTLGFGLYSTSGTRLVHWDSVSGAGGGGVTHATPTGGAQLEPPGYYFWCWASTVTGTGAPNTLGSLANGTSNENSEPWNRSTVRGGTAANAMSAGVLPATLGTLTAGFNNGNSALPAWTIEP
jgi:hypothetical protein